MRMMFELEDCVYGICYSLDHRSTWICCDFDRSSIVWPIAQWLFLKG